MPARPHPARVSPTFLWLHRDSTARPPVLHHTHPNSTGFPPVLWTTCRRRWLRCERSEPRDHPRWSSSERQRAHVETPAPLSAPSRTGRRLARRWWLRCLAATGTGWTVLARRCRPSGRLGFETVAAQPPQPTVALPVVEQRRAPARSARRDSEDVGGSRGRWLRRDEVPSRNHPVVEEGRSPVSKPPPVVEQRRAPARSARRTPRASGRLLREPGCWLAHRRTRWLRRDEVPSRNHPQRSSESFDSPCG